MSTSHKVLMLVENLSVPADPRVWREACTLHRYGFQVSIICPKGMTRDQESYICLEGIHIYRYRLSTTIQKSSDYIKEYSVAMLMTFWLSLRVLFCHGFDVIHAANPPDTFFALGLFYKLLHKKYVFDQHDLAPEMFHVKFQNRMKTLYKLLLFFERMSYKTADIVITTNESQKRIATQRGGYLEENVFVVRNGPDVTHFTALISEPELVLKQGRPFLLAYVGVMGTQDGVEHVLYALDELVHIRKRQDVSLVLMGDGDQLPTLKALTRQLDLEDVVHFTGWVTKTDMSRYLTVTDIGLSPDPSNELNDNSTMLKTMEYMAMGKPVVAFDLPETRFSAQDAGLYATPNEIASFADNIETLLDNEVLRLQKGASGRKRIEEALCWDHTKVNLLIAYNSLFPKSVESQSQIAETPTQTFVG
ncbi:MAG: glycosyltransferase family 4 protein [Ktedonobacteraceae bacterium]